MKELEKMKLDNFIGVENLVGLGHTVEEAKKINSEVKSEGK